MAFDQIIHLFLYSSGVRRKEEMTKKEMILDVLKAESKGNETKGTKWVAYVIGDMAHIGQYRDNGHHYFTHPKHCVNMFYDLVSIEGWVRDSVLVEHDIPYGVVELSYLHDVVEDTKLTHQDVKAIFIELGYKDFFESFIDEPLKLITHDKSEDYDTYIGKVMEHPLSAFVKMLDLADNMNLFGLGKLEDEEIERVNKYSKYFKRINDKYNYLEKLKECRSDMVLAYDD